MIWCRHTPGDARVPLGRGRRTSAPVAKLLANTSPSSQHPPGSLLCVSHCERFPPLCVQLIQEIHSSHWSLRNQSCVRLQRCPDDAQTSCPPTATPRPNSHSSARESCITPSVEGRGRSPGTVLPAATLPQTVKVY